ncbi:putative alpha/beta superfamily hydrolase [Flavobacterium sp. CG_23.5]|uniref:alpha/beta hydrolase n=1 Tax=Flavobacterium sp. CG_23.5 TaxID=2760708 RepID=UPI001AE7849C|nr:alpha/beta hydrolase-fold protein [Flavobacterium sp. CG_23.5]MBP2283783.1 putative alpha/beta superfamily hydrolase [Flavobacterium sp. CG_23.5]
MKQILLLLFFSISVFSQKTVEAFDSKKLGESREITIGLPASYEKNPNKRYPILILLDGDYLFDPFYGALSYGAYWDDLPETIIVGINQNKKDERVNDSNYDETDAIPSGKGAQFFEFIGGELLPYLEKKYRVAPFRIIAGHDTTAGYLNFFLYKDSPLFNAYISLSPELAPEMENRIPEKLSKLKQPIFYYQSTSDGDVKKLQEPIKKLDENIKLANNPLLNYKFDYFKGASHYSLVLYSIPSALYQFFDSYKPISSTEYTDKIAILPSGHVDYLTTKYDLIAKNLGLKIPIRINDFKAIEAAILKNKDYQELDKLAAIAKKNYPKSMLSDYELGLMYEKTGDAKKAAKMYQNATQLEEIGNLTKDMMFQKLDDMKSLTPKK